MASNVADSGNMKVVTEIYSSSDPRVAQLRKTNPPQSHDSNITQAFAKAQPKALATVQIVVGLLQVLFGIVVTVSEVSHATLTTTSGVYFWLGVTFFISGCLTVDAETKNRVWLVKTSVAANLVAFILALVALVIHIMELTAVMTMVDEEKDSEEEEPRWTQRGAGVHTLKIGCNIMFLIFILLELGTTMTILAFGYKALWNVQRYDPMN
ncbi:membrane-spanning 4-domains subfamily A member 15-like [Ambystoma mexicanum]|uniref:membrane-spanning 4-domains subfamily A member 15-like n=1 Tax=Ambystoma mexicanum TaxID=8296 RepID=UPI0037E74AD8